MSFTATDYSPEDLADLLAGTRQVLDATWELSLLGKDVAELVAFLINTLRKEPNMVTEPFIANVAQFWSLTLADVEVAVLELLVMHEESSGNSIIDDLATLEIIFSV